MSAYIGSLGSFDYKNQEWAVYYGRLMMFIKLNDIKSEKQSAVLLTNLSDDSYRLVSNLLHPKKIEEATFSELVNELNAHFTPRRSTFADRSKFYEAVKMDGESAEEWAARLRGMAVHCGFGSELNVLLRDRFVLGFRSGPERDRLCEQDLATLTFAKALEIAQQAACARQARNNNTTMSVSVKEEPIFKSNMARAGAARSMRDGRPPAAGACTVCGMKNHVAEKCRYKNYRCNKCNNKGHLKKVCQLNINNIATYVEGGSQAQREREDNHECEECQLFNMRFDC
ncbi:uncharacterized protein LOC126381112 [Pectinophora gossypiella]|uniref:uncharacterized protein LOC126367365 n=1 Tax=Pectinophora gossypiella TaxID=13191 RepID=UPI00214E641D|nr:uncharacterized protein LOC126367365 [Pectinophora gossypiella]XP_049886607.1 uncharacterized protein LOC126381112 [Pectinophora gossypiella]